MILPLAPGLVSEYEERSAALFGLYTWSQWARLPRAERVQAVAHYRLTRLIEAHLSEQATTTARRRAAAAQTGQNGQRGRGSE